MHYVNKQNLCKEHRLQQKGKAMGIDRVSKEDYGEALEANIEDLLARMKTFSYRSQAVRRTYIPKAGSDQMRPLGIPAYEDKLVQGVMRKVLDQIYEGKFYSFSYGFGEGKSCHQAIREINQLIMTKKISFVVDADIKGFFDNVDHEWLMKFLEHDIASSSAVRKNLSNNSLTQSTLPPRWMRIGKNLFMSERKMTLLYSSARKNLSRMKRSGSSTIPSAMAH